MKLLLDQNISFRVITKLLEIYPEMQGVRRLGLTNKDDLEIWQFAKANNYCIITNDTDFSALSTYYGAPPKVIWIRRQNLSNTQFVELMIQNKDVIYSFLSEREQSKTILEIY